MPISRNIFFLIFTLSGFSGLIYESIWTHYLKLFLGHAAYAQALVLAIFMGGMAVGSFLCSRYSTRWRRLLLLYAVAEAAVGVFALLYHDGFEFIVNYAYTNIIPQLGSSANVILFKWLLATLLILPQSILLGMTFPLMTAGVIRRFPDKAGATISMLYFTNSLGGAIGVLASGFIMIDWVGLPGTITIAGIINLVLATIVWLLVGKQPDPNFNVQTEKHGPIPSSTWLVLLVTASFITGAASFIYEISWIRMLSLVLGSSTHAFELMLSAFILGLAFGSLWIKRRIERIPNTIRFLAWMQLFMGLFALLTLVVYGNVFNVMQWLLNNIDKTDSGYLLFNLSSHAVALSIMLPATFCAGTTLPLITYSLIKKGFGEKSIGVVYGSNTVGAILGVFFAIHFGLPLLGLKNLLVFAAALDILLAFVLMWRFSAYGSIRTPAIASAIAVAFVGGVIIFAELDAYKMASGVYRKAQLLDASNTELLAHADGKTASIDLTRSRSGKVSIRTNGKTDAAVNMTPGGRYSPDESTMILAAAIPLLINPGAQSAANIGMGSGLTSHSLLTSPTLKTVDTIEIERQMVEIAKGFIPHNENVYHDDRSRIYIDDAKSFFSTHQRRYDIIVSEPSNPWVSGVAGLFSHEFYRLIKRHLNQDGLLVQWFQLYEIDFELVASVFKALSNNFSDYVIYASSRGDILIIAKQQGEIPPLSAGLFASPAFKRQLKRIDINHLQDVEIRKVGDKQLLTPLIESYSIAANSDYYPVLDQNAARTRFLNANATDLIGMIQLPIPALEILGVSHYDWSQTNISPSPNFALTESFETARLMKQALLAETPTLLPVPYGKKINSSLIDIYRLLHHCQVPAHGDKVYLLYQLMIHTVPYLRPHELQTIWTILESAQCSTSWNDNEKTWLDFVMALSARNNPAIRDTATRLLNDKHPLTDTRRKYLVMALMLATIAEDELDLANQIWRRYAGLLYQDKQPNMLFKLLAATSGAGHKEPGSRRTGAENNSR